MQIQNYPFNSHTFMLYLFFFLSPFIIISICQLHNSTSNALSINELKITDLKVLSLSLYFKPMRQACDDFIILMHTSKGEHINLSHCLFNRH